MGKKEEEVLIPDIEDDDGGDGVEFSREEIKETVSRIENALTQPSIKLAGKRKRKTFIDINSYATCLNCSFVYLKIAKDLREEVKNGHIPEDKRMYYAKLMKTMLAGVESLVAISKPSESESRVVNNLGIGFVIDGKRI